MPGLELGIMFRRVAKDVYAETNGEQSPELSFSMVPEYYLNQTETDQTSWERIRANRDPGALRAFVDAYPTSLYAPDARALLDLLEHEAQMKEELAAEGRQREEMKASLTRLQANQEAINRAVAEASAPPPDLVDKLAATEAERQRLEQELSKRAADQAAAEARARQRSNGCKRNGSNARPTSVRKSKKSKLKRASLIRRIPKRGSGQRTRASGRPGQSASRARARCERRDGSGTASRDRARRGPTGQAGAARATSR